MKTFVTLSQRDCAASYKEMIQTSDSHWESAEILAKNGKHGTAMSLVFISIEELIKALIIYLDSLGFKFRKVKGIEMLFKDHRIRFFIAFFMSVAAIFGQDGLRWLRRIKLKPALARLLAEQIKDNRQNYFELYFQPYLLKKFLLFVKELNWFKNAEVFRQRGFYSDYENLLITPISVSATEFKEVMVRLTKVRIFIKNFIETFEKSPDLQEKYLSDFIIKMERTKTYLAIGKVIAKLRKENKSPFEQLMSFLKSNDITPDIFKS